MFGTAVVVGLLSIGGGAADFVSHDSLSRPHALASMAVSRPVARSLDDYVLFAFDTLSLKGGDLPGRGEIRGGDVGANGTDANPADSHFVADVCANHKVVMDDGSQVNADSLRITKDCDVWDVFANTLNAGSDVVPRHSGPNSFTTPLLLGQPSFPSFSCNGANPFTVGKHVTATMPPGTYGAVNLEDGSHTTLQPGAYAMCELRAGKDAMITTAAGVELRIAKAFSISNGTTFGPECSVPVFVRGDGASGVHDFAVAFSKHTQVAGRFLTLAGGINLGDDTDLSGQFVGNRISSDKNVNVHGCRPPVVTTTTIESAPTTASIGTTTLPMSSSTTTSTSTVPRRVTTTSLGSLGTTVASPTSTTSTTSPTAGPTTTIPKGGPSRLPRTGLDLGLVVVGIAFVVSGSLALVRRARTRGRTT